MNRKFFKLDPRTKLFLIIIAALVVLSRLGGEKLCVFQVILTVVPYILLWAEKEYSYCLKSLIGLLISYCILYIPYVWDNMLVGTLAIVVGSIFSRMIPTVAIGYYVVKSTKISEFVGGMEKMHVSEKIINTFVQKGFHTIGALKTNRLLYPSGMKKKLSELAAERSTTHKGFDLVTVKKRNYYVYRYEGNLSGIENAVVLLSYPEKAFGNPKALRAFISTNVSLSTQEILSCYVCRWPIEIFFRQCKNHLALDTYQIRSSKGIQRYWLLMSLTHYICVTGTGGYRSFQDGYHRICSAVHQEKYQYLFLCAKASDDFEAFMKLAG